MHIHILGICGTFMAGIAQIAKQAGHKVSGCDADIYPPMSDLLKDLGVDLYNGYSEKQIDLQPDIFIIGNAISRGNPLLEEILNRRLRYTSAPQWLAQNILDKRKVIAIAGTHGKTTTTSMLTWILSRAGLAPGYLIGGVAQNFNNSADLGEGEYFVIEADEYDTAFFDKRPKFLHYHPSICVITNLEYDHADIYSSLAEIERQFHYLIRTVPANGLIVREGDNDAIDRVVEQGCWTSLETLASAKQSGWWIKPKSNDHSTFDVFYDENPQGCVSWDLIGEHYAYDALAAVAVAKNIGVDPSLACEYLNQFKQVKRRLELKAEIKGIRIFDDFAHHPTAINKTLMALKSAQNSQNGRLFALVEFGSYSMKHGVHSEKLNNAFLFADKVFTLTPDYFELNNPKIDCSSDVDEIVEKVACQIEPNDTIVVMSNRGFNDINTKLAKKLQSDI
jgi:UDP-N-acetylmuramate: L-alanyl-gamma-D-glutamyl-meso-diaminopimelate ligase